MYKLRYSVNFRLNNFSYDIRFTSFSDQPKFRISEALLYIFPA
jgi:hypothetical protein